MKTKIITGLLVTSIVTGGNIPINTLATPIVQAETQQEGMDISSSLRKLGAQSKLIQTYIDQSLMSPNVQLEEVPALNTNQYEGMVIGTLSTVNSIKFKKQRICNKI